MTSLRTNKDVSLSLRDQIICSAIRDELKGPDIVRFVRSKHRQDGSRSTGKVGKNRENKRGYENWSPHPKTLSEEKETGECRKKTRQKKEGV